jgi:hypothetical protein
MCLNVGVSSTYLHMHVHTCTQAGTLCRRQNPSCLKISFGMAHFSMKCKKTNHAILSQANIECSTSMRGKKKKARPQSLNTCIYVWGSRSLIPYPDFPVGCRLYSSRAQIQLLAAAIALCLGDMHV